MTDPTVLSEVTTWLRYAKEDLDEARHMLRRRLSIPRHACFLAQQSAEKALKAVLVFCQVDFPWRHDLAVLASLIPPGWTCRERNESLAELTEWAVESRYPGDAPDASKEDARRAVEQSGQVWQSVIDDFRIKGIDLPP